MTKRLLLSCLLLPLLLASGCSLFRKSGRPKENSGIAGEVEASFQRRWIERRTGELVAQGTAADAARTQAAREFGEKFEFTNAAKK